MDFEEIRRVHRKTVRAVPNAGIVPDNSSFVYKSNGNPVKKGVHYHIHYTTDFQEVYMTGSTHQVNSRIIVRLEGKNDYQKYSDNPAVNYKLQKPKMIRPTPKVKDYLAGHFMRYFAKKANDESEPIVEVTSNFKSDLYKIYSLKWMIRGNLRVIYKQNYLTATSFKNKRPEITKLLSNPLEYVKIPEVSNNVDIKKRLGILNIPKDAQGNIVFDPEALTPPVKMGLDEGPGKFSMKGPKKGGGIGKMRINKGALARYGAGGGGSGGGGSGGGGGGY